MRIAGACLLALAAVAGRADEAGAAATAPTVPSTDVTADAPDVTTEAPLTLPPGCQGAGLPDARWFDRAQGYFSQQACTPAVWFDRFFGDEREDNVASTLVRVIPQVQYSDRDFTDVTARVRARFNLPHLKDRFNLVVNEEDAAQQGLLPGEEARPARDNAAAGEGASAALRYLVRLAGQSGADFDIGLRARLKFLARARYYRTWNHSPTLQTRFTQSVYFLDGEGWGETSLHEVERMVAADMLVRLATQGTLSQSVDGFEWREGVQLYRQLDRDRAISWGVAMQVDSNPAWQATSYATSVRYRQRIFRPWFFYEVEPFVDWIREDRFNSNPGIAFRVEVWIGDTGGHADQRKHRPATSPEPPPEAAPLTSSSSADAPVAP